MKMDVSLPSHTDVHIHGQTFFLTIVLFLVLALNFLSKPSVVLVYRNVFSVCGFVFNERLCLNDL